MTLRAVALGLVGAGLICGITYFNDHVIRQGWLINTNVPFGVYGLLILFLVALNPAIAKMKKAWALRDSEIAVAMAITLAACCIPSAGLMETFPDAVMMPHHFERVEPGWRDGGVLDLAPDFMTADVRGNESVALNGYVNGLGVGAEHIRVNQVPWSAWWRTLGFWIPLVLLFWIALIGLAVVVHHQWSRNEQLPYPIAQFTSSLLPAEGEVRSPVLRDVRFWWVAGAVMLIHLINYLYQWWPEHMFAIPLRLDGFTSLSELFPTLTKGGGMGLFMPRIIFSIIAFAYVLPTDTSFSLGIGPFFYFFIAGLLAGYGISVSSGGYGDPSIQSSLMAGAWVGVMAVIVYTGRNYYRKTLAGAFGLARDREVAAESVWGMRIFIVCSAIFTADLMLVGLDWVLAILFTIAAVGIFLVIGRISAETGHPFIQPYWAPTALMVGLFGIQAIGPSAIVILGLLSTVLLVDTREALTPFLLNSFKVLEGRTAGVGKTAIWCGVALVVGLAVAVPTTLYLKYDQGTDKAYGWASEMVPKLAFDHGLRTQIRLQGQGSLEKAESLGGLSRLWAMRPEASAVVSFIAALGLVFGLSALRFRLPRWPLHPVFLLVWSTYAGFRFAWPFLIGCAIKVAVLKYGGDRAARSLKPAMFGLVAGDMIFGAGTAIFGGIYYAFTGHAPPGYSPWSG